VEETPASLVEETNEIIVEAQPAEPSVEESDVLDAAASSVETLTTFGEKGKQFLQWVLEQGGGNSLDTIDPQKYADKTAELSSFFEKNLPYVHGPDRAPLDAYFEKMGCEAKCSSCPNGTLQAIFCYGVFDEEVTALNINDANESDQFFKLTDAGSFASAPTI
jgi:hypothetical protein